MSGWLEHPTRIWKSQKATTIHLRTMLKTLEVRLALLMMVTSMHSQQENYPTIKDQPDTTNICSLIPPLRDQQLQILPTWSILKMTTTKQLISCSSRTTSK